MAGLNTTKGQKLTVIRHGSTLLNDENKNRGWINVGLDEHGKEEAHTLGKALEGHGVDFLIASDLLRTKQTADIISKETGIPIEGYTPYLRPWNIGNLTGKDIQETLPIIQSHIRDTPNEPLPGGESFNDFKNRTVEGLKYIIQNYPHKHISIVTHHRVERLIKAFVTKGTGNDEIEKEEMMVKGEPPGSSITYDLEPRINTDALKLAFDGDSDIENILDSKERKESDNKIKSLKSDLDTIQLTPGDDGEDGSKGEKGDKGDTGEKGIQGEKGEQGDRGLRGYNGDDGKDGKNGVDGKDGKDAFIDEELLDSAIDRKVLLGMKKIDGRIKLIDQRWGGHGGGSKGGVTSLNGETGALNIVAGSGITVTPSGQNITIDSTSSGGSPGGSSGDIQYNNSGAFGGVTLVPLANGGTALANTITTLTTNGTITAMPVASSIIRYASTTGATIEGIAAPNGSQRIILQCAFGSINITLKNQNTGATAANRLQLQNGQDLALAPGTQVELFYNTTDSRWEQSDFRSPVGVNNVLSTQNIFSNAGGTPGGTSNIVFGNGAVGAGTFNGSNAVILGNNAAKNATNTSGLIAIGNGAAGTAILTGGENIFIGSNTGALTTSGSENLFVGADNGQSNTTGQGNVYLGGSSGLTNTTGSQNIGIGFDAGGTNITGSNQIMIGGGTQVQTNTNLNNVIAIGTSVRPTTSDTMLLGGTGSPVNVGINNDLPAYRLDVGGDINTNSAFRINGVVQTPWTLQGNAGTSPGADFVGTTDATELWFETNSTFVAKITVPGLTGFQEMTPKGVVHTGNFTAVVGIPSSINTSINIVGTGYSFGSGDKNYTTYGSQVVMGTQIFSSSGISITFSEPPTSNFDPTGGSASFIGGSGYTASGYDFNYTVWALYGGQTLISVGSGAVSDTGTDPNDGSTYDVGASWGTPLGASPDAYLVQIGGSNPNSGQYQVVFGTSLDDNGTGWTSSASYAGIFYTVNVSYGAGIAATEYRTLNTTSTTFIDDTVPTQSVIDDGSWASGSTVTPTSATYPSVYSDGDVVVSNTSYGVVLQSPNGSYWRISVSNIGIITASAL